MSTVIFQLPNWKIPGLLRLRSHPRSGKDPLFPGVACRKGDRPSPIFDQAVRFGRA